MWNSKKSVNLSLVVCFVTIILIVILSLFINNFAINYFDYANDSDHAQYLKYIAFIGSFYPCAILGIVAVISLIKMLFRIKNENSFCKENVKSLKVISWCCFIVALITFIGGFFYLPLIVVTVAAGFFGLILRVVKNVIHSAIELREENDLTI